MAQAWKTTTLVLLIGFALLHMPRSVLGLRWLTQPEPQELCLGEGSSSAALNATLEMIAYEEVSDDFQIILNGEIIPGSEIKQLSPAERIALANNYARQHGIDCPDPRSSDRDSGVHDQSSPDETEELIGELEERVDDLEDEIDRLLESDASQLPPIYTGYNPGDPLGILTHDPDYAFQMGCRIDELNLQPGVYILDCMRLP